MLFIWLFLYGIISLLSKAVAPLFSIAPTVGLVLYTIALVIWIQVSEKGAALGFQTVSISSVKKHFFFIFYFAPVFYNLFRFGFSFPAVRLLPGIICAVVLEEILFRGVLPAKLCRHSLFWGIILSSFAFGVVHLVNLERGMEPVMAVCQVIFALCVGFALSGLRLSCGSIYPGMVIHLLINVTASGYDVVKDPLFWLGALICVICGIRDVSFLRKESTYEIIY